MTVRYSHTNIIARNWRVLADFYRDVFDCVPVPPVRKQSGAWLERGAGVADAALEGMHLRLPGHGEHGPTLEIFSYQRMDENPPTAVNRLGLRHLAFTVDDVSACLEKVVAHGGRALGEVARHLVTDAGTITFVYAADPEDNIIEIQHWE